MDTPELSPEDSERVQALRKALEEEFEVRSTAPTSSIKDLHDLKPDALEALRYVLRHNNTDSLRVKVAMWVYDRCVSSEDAKTTDELLDLLQNMPKQTHESTST